MKPQAGAYLLILGVALLAMACARQSPTAHVEPPIAAADPVPVSLAYAPSTPALEASVAAGMPMLPAFFVGVNVYDLAADRPTGYECNVPDGLDAALVLDQTFATLKAHGVEVVRFWAFQTYATTDQTGERYWGAFDRVMERALHHGIYLIPVLDNQWRDCNRLRAFTASLARRTSDVSVTAWTEQFADRYPHAPAIFAFEVKNEPAAASADESAVHAMRDDLWRRVAAVKARTDKPVGLGSIGDEEPGFAGDAFAATHEVSGATIATTHDYHGWDIPIVGGCGLSTSQCRNLEAARQLGLQLYVGEGGSRGCDDEAKAELLRQKIESASRAGAIGYLYWGFSMRAPLSNCGFDSGPDGEVIKVFSSF